MTTKMTPQQKTELLDWASACQSAYHIESNPGHRFGGLPGALQENRDALVAYVEKLLAEKEAELEALRADKARLDWLETNGVIPIDSVTGKKGGNGVKVLAAYRNAIDTIRAQALPL